MTITRATTEAVLVSRLGEWLIAASLDGTTVDGTNADLADPIAWALRTTGYTVASAGAPANSDLDDVTDADTDKLFDLAELRTLLSIYQNYKKVDGKAGPVEGKADQLAQRMRARIADLRAQIFADYGVGGSGAAFSVGMVRTDGYSELAAL